MRVLLDENLPFGMRRLFPDHDVRHAIEIGWSGLANGKLITAAEAGGFELLVTGDTNLSFQQSWQRRRIALLVLSSNHWPTVRASQDLLREAVSTMRPGEVRSLRIGA